MQSILTGEQLSEHSAREGCLELGFVEDAEAWQLMSYQLPSKIGGRPAWLSFENLPSLEELQCPLCHKQMVFLLQLYCPIDERDDCYHRAIFVFMCRQGGCYTNAGDSRPLKVFRCQLPQDNPYLNSLNSPNEYPPLEEVQTLFSKGVIKHVTQFSSICDVCGCSGSLICAQCKQVNYCCKAHQQIGWKSAGHKEACAQLKAGSLKYDKVFNFSTNSLLLPEYALYLGPDPEAENRDEKTKEEAKSLEDILVTPNDCEMDELEKLARQETDEDKIFLKFKKEIKSEPDQVLRYARGGLPLWISNKALVDCSGIIPPCEHCGGPRIFEFQVTPQMLHYLHLTSDVDSSNLNATNNSLINLAPDWGCLYIYTCKESCSPAPPAKGAYMTEFIVRHDIG